MRKAKLVVFLLVIVGGESGIIKRDAANSSSKDELSNHTSAVIESVLQNIHRLKNYEERERLERLVTRFKMLVQELHKNTSPLADSDATNNVENEVNKPPSMANWRTLSKAMHGMQNELTPNGKNVQEIDKVLPKLETQNVVKNDNGNKSELVKSSSLPALPAELTSESSEDNNSDELDNDEDDDELVQQLRQKPEEMDKDEKERISDEEDELISVAEHHGSDEDTTLEDGSNSQPEDEEKIESELQDDLKLLNKVIGKLRQVKTILKRLQVEESRRR